MVNLDEFIRYVSMRSNFYKHFSRYSRYCYICTLVLWELLNLSCSFISK